MYSLTRCLVILTIKNEKIGVPFQPYEIVKLYLSKCDFLTLKTRECRAVMCNKENDTAATQCFTMTNGMQ